MTDRTFVLDMLRLRGAAEARALRTAAAELDGTAIIAREVNIPGFDPGADYSTWPAGAPVTHGEQVYKLLQPHNAANYPGSTPANTPALWSIAHTRDPARAKPYAPPQGVSGIYMQGECCMVDGAVYRSSIDNNNWAPADYPAGWELIETEEET